MFTGLITDMGELVAREGGRLEITCGYDADTIAIGASIACNGCCLTVTEVARAGIAGARFAVDVSNETLSRTTIGDWQVGRKINLERPLTLGAELGGHIVTGHVDGVAEIVTRRADGESVRFTLSAPEVLAPYLAEKGSIALDGVSLTINSVEDATFSVNLIPHTLAVTNWGGLDVGDRVNLEVDLLARYVARLAETSRGRST